MRQRHYAIPGAELLGYPPIARSDDERLGKEKRRGLERPVKIESDNEALSLSSVQDFDNDARGDSFNHEHFDIAIADDGLPSLLDLAMRESRGRARLEDVQQRYERLLCDLARIRLRIDQFAADVACDEAEDRVR